MTYKHCSGCACYRTEVQDVATVRLAAEVDADHLGLYEPTTIAVVLHPAPHQDQRARSLSAGFCCKDLA